VDHLLGCVRAEVNDEIQAIHSTAKRAPVRHTDGSSILAKTFEHLCLIASRLEAVERGVFE
jgi:hypothetical protein